MSAEPTVRVTAYAVSCLPPDHPDAYHFTLRVEARGNDRWCVTDGAYCYNAAGEQDYEPLPSSREEEWLSEYRFDVDTALALAKRIAPTLKAGRFTVDEVLTRVRR